MSGTLWIVATPIGNLEDLSPRAARVLAGVAMIAAEDTRISRRLGVDGDSGPKWLSLHEHNEERVAGDLLRRLQAGDDVALVSDAGTPLISDPGYRLVAAAHDAGIRVSPVPGPCAAVAALSVAGLATDRFRFEGFLPPRSAARRRRLEALAREAATLVFYVPARDLAPVLADLQAVLGGDRLATVARELSKQFETVRRDRLDALAEWIGADPDQSRGEAVVLVEGSSADGAERLLDVHRLARELASELPPARAARLVARLSGMDRKQAFTLVESFRKPGTDSGSNR